MVDAKPFMEIGWQRFGRQGPDTGNSWPGERQALSASEALNLQYERGRAVRILGGAERKVVEGWRVRGLGNDGE